MAGKSYPQGTWLGNNSWIIVIILRESKIKHCAFNKSNPILILVHLTAWLNAWLYTYFGYKRRGSISEIIILALQSQLFCKIKTFQYVEVPSCFGCCGHTVCCIIQYKRQCKWRKSKSLLNIFGVIVSVFCFRIKMSPFPQISSLFTIRLGKQVIDSFQSRIYDFVFYLYVIFIFISSSCRYKRYFFCEKERRIGQWQNLRNESSKNFHD